MKSLLTFAAGAIIGILFTAHVDKAELSVCRDALADSRQISRTQARALDVAENLLMALDISPRVLDGIPVRARVTAYSNDPISINVPAWRDGKTATMTTARLGVAAADWRIFPPGTRVFIPGYGEAVVEDRGGRVKGLHFDVFTDTYDEARQWGSRVMTVYVIGKAGA